MGRYLKNVKVVSASYALKLPIGTSTLGPESPETGQIRFNSTTNKVEFYFNGQWGQLAKDGTVSVVMSDFVGNGVQTTFSPLVQQEQNANNILVFIGGVYQRPTDNYTISTTSGVTSITFTSPPPAPTGLNTNKIVIIHNLNSTVAV